MGIRENLTAAIPPAAVFFQKGFQMTFFSECDLSCRSANCLKNAEITTLEELAERSEREMLSIPNFGRKSLNELKDLLADHDMSFRDETEPARPSRRRGEYTPKLPEGALVDEAADLANQICDLVAHTKKLYKKRRLLWRKVILEYYPEYKIPALALTMGSSEKVGRTVLSEMLADCETGALEWWYFNCIDARFKCEDEKYAQREAEIRAGLERVFRRLKANGMEPPGFS